MSKNAILTRGLLPKKDAIAEHIRDRIVRRELPPGSRLPARVVIENEFEASSVTVQQAFDRLSREGFVSVKPKRGTYVSETPPHLSRYALVFPIELNKNTFLSRYYSTLSNESLVMQQAEARRFASFYGIDGQTDGDDFKRLVREICAQRLAGLIFANVPFGLEDTPVFEDPGLPRVGFSNKPHPLIAAVNLSVESFIERSLAHMADRGRRRVSFLAVGDGLFQEGRFDQLQQQCAAIGLETRPNWIQAADPSNPTGARNQVDLLMCCKDQPDALIVMDDNLVEYASAGILAAGKRVPEDIEVVGHRNFPDPLHSALPIQWIGFDLRRAFRICVELIDRQRRGEKVPPITSLSAVTSEECGLETLVSQPGSAYSLLQTQ